MFDFKPVFADAIVFVCGISQCLKVDDNGWIHTSHIKQLDVLESFAIHCHTMQTTETECELYRMRQAYLGLSDILDQ